MAPAARYGLLRKRLDSLTRDADGIYQGDVEAVHKTRVASRRLRELVPVLQLEHDTARTFRRALRKLTRQLGAARELDVLTLLIQELGQDPRYSTVALRLVSTEVNAARTAAHKRLASRFPVAKIHRLARRLGRVAKRLKDDADRSPRQHQRRSTPAWVSALEARTARRAAGVQSAIQAAGTVYSLEGVHNVRIALKKLRYAAELGAEARRTRTTADLRALKAAQDVLGRLHDLEMLIKGVRHAQVSLSPPDLTMWRELASLVRTLEDDCRTLHAGYIHERSKLTAIADRLGGKRRQTGRASRRTLATSGATERTDGLAAPLHSSPGTEGEYRVSLETGAGGHGSLGTDGEHPASPGSHADGPDSRGADADHADPIGLRRRV